MRVHYRVGVQKKGRGRGGNRMRPCIIIPMVSESEEGMLQCGCAEQEERGEGGRDEAMQCHSHGESSRVAV